MADKYMYPGRALEPGGFGKYPISELVSFEDKPRAKPVAPAPAKKQAVGASGTWDEPSQAAPAAIQAAQPQAAPAAVKRDYATQFDGKEGGNATDEQWNTFARDFRSAAPGQSVNEYRQGNPGAIQTVDVKPASGNYNPENVRIQRDQDEYWGARLQMANATTPQEKKMAIDRLSGVRADDTSRRGQDTTRYGYDQQRATGQDSSASRQMLQDTDPTKPAGAIASLQQGEYYGAQAGESRQKAVAAKTQNDLYERAMAGDQSALKLLMKGRDKPAGFYEGRAKIIAEHGYDANDPDALSRKLQLYEGSDGATSSGVTKEMIDAKVKDPAERAKAYAHYGLTEKHAQGGAVGYAQGGEIASPLADPMQQVHPMVGEYRRYSMMAQQLGATPVSFEQFGALRQSAATQGHQVAPMQENFAAGGGVGMYGGEAVRRRVDAAEAQAMGGVQNISAPAPTQQAAPTKSYDQIDADIAAARARMNKPKNWLGFAEGGAIEDPYRAQQQAAERYSYTAGLEDAANRDDRVDVRSASNRGALGGRIQRRAAAAVAQNEEADLRQNRARGALDAYNNAAPRTGSDQPAIMGGSTNPYGNATFDTGSLNQGGGSFWERSSGYAEGGAIEVGGRQVLGPGDGKSDSIPAVIDGKRPAALSTGEFVFPVEAVRHFGMDRLNKMVEAARKPQGA